jgi:NAD(P)-dependent dehydrogenase (short-subunit alcohol dehydrogenase family)
MKTLSYDLAPDQVGVLLLHPGWVKTRMGGDSAPLTPQQSVYNMRILIDRFTLKKSGRFYRHDGSMIPW